MLYLEPDADPVAVAALLAAVEEVRRTRRTRLVAVRVRSADDAWVPVLVGQDGPLRPYPRVPLDPLPLPPGLITREGARVWPLVDGTVLGAGLVPSDTPDALRVHRAAVQAAAALAVPGAGIAVSGAPLAVLLGAATVFGNSPNRTGHPFDPRAHHRPGAGDAPRCGWAARARRSCAPHKPPCWTEAFRPR